MVNLVRHDLEFILKQIKIAEAHSAGTPLADIRMDEQGKVLVPGDVGYDAAVPAISHPLAPSGLRTVDGSYNNLTEDRSQWGASDNVFVRITDPFWRNEGDDQIVFGMRDTNGDGIPDTPIIYNNNNYGQSGGTSPAPGQPAPGTVIDADPRIISNLIVDQTLDNPAAIYAALVHAGVTGTALMPALNEIRVAKEALDTAIANSGPTPAELVALQEALEQAEADAASAAAAAAAAQAQAQAAEDAYDAALAEVGLAQQGVDAAQEALLALAGDGIPTSAQQAEIDAAFAALEAAALVLDAKELLATNAQATMQASAAAAEQAATLSEAAAAKVVLAEQALSAAQEAQSGAEADIAAADAALDAVLVKHGIEMDGDSVLLPNVAPDEGLSAPYNSWFTLFGQFFDHGLDLVQKSGNGTVYIPLQPDDPLYVAGSHTNFMAVTRTSADANNITTPWVDQNQTYGSTASKQLFMREYEVVDGKPLATGRLLEGGRDGLATWADVKAQASTKLGFALTDADVGMIPVFKMDAYGEFVRGPNGLPQVLAAFAPDGSPIWVEGDLANPVNPSAIQLPIGTVIRGTGNSTNTIEAGETVSAARTAHAFLDDIAHAAAPVLVNGVLQADGDSSVGYSGGYNDRGGQTSYDNELLDAHYITGDGRGNENIGLSAVHHIFHSEHNHLVDQVKQRAIESGDLNFLNEWLRVPVTTFPADEASLTALKWDGERLFQAARFTNEMEYQHLVFEEFARKVQPDVDAFVFNPSTDINPAIFSEFAHVVYRFGHSMLNQTVDRINPDGTKANMDLFAAFLNPLAFGSAEIDHAAAAGAIVRGMTSQVGNEIDEFVTDVLRNQLLGVPLDLAAINIARGRDAGIPPLNEARRQFREIANGDTQLDPYTSWADFALNLKNPASIVNFIAAYGTHSSITGTAEARRDAAWKLVFGDQALDPAAAEAFNADRLAFLNATGNYAGGKLGGLEDVDLWVGGLAEKKMAFGGMLGSTFSFIFELQLENLQNADRFYYLSRVQGLNLLNELENNSFAKMVLNNTDLAETGYAVPGDIFSVPDHVMYVNKNIQTMFGHVDPTHDDPFLEGISKLVERVDVNNDGIAEYIRYNGNDHVLIQGTNDNDHIVAGGGDDSVWGRDGNDRIEAGYGVDKIHGGKGDDIITNSGTDIGEVDMLHGEEGNDVIHGGSGLALVFGNEGQDFLIAGPDGKEVFGGLGNDFILGGEGGDFLLGNEGDDWIEAGNGFDTTAGDNSELFFNSTIIGHDVMFAGQNEHDFDAESGDDIMVQGESVMRNEGMFGYDWSIHKGNSEAADSDLMTPIFTTVEQDILRDRFDQVEALSGWNKNDVLRGDNRGDQDAETPPPGANGDAVETVFTNNELSQAGVDRIDGLRALLGDWVAAAPTTGDLEKIIAFDDGNILLGGGGNDLIQGRGGNDLIDGDRWLNVRIRITVGNETYTSDGMGQKVYREADYKDGAPVANAVAHFGGKTLDALMLDRTLNPGQLSIVREIVVDDGVGDTDTAVYGDVRANYTISQNADGSIRVSHDTVTAGLVSDGVDKLLNIEKIRFADGEITLSPPKLTLHAFEQGNYRDDFSPSNYQGTDGTVTWTPGWAETDDDGSATSSNGQILVSNGVLRFEDGNGATITRTVNLAGAESARLSFSANPDNLENDDYVSVQFSADGVTFAEIDRITGDGGTENLSFNLTGPFTANAAIRFVATSFENGGIFGSSNDVVQIDNVTVDFSKPAATPTVNHETTFTENSAVVAIAANPGIVEDSGVIRGATIVLTNAQAGDALNVPVDLPGNITRTIDTSVPGRITVTMTGTESIGNYQAAIQQVTFSSNSQNPSTVDRIIQVTVNDGFLNSNVATTTVNVVSVNDAPAANNDSVFTNYTTAPFILPEWALLANDTDGEGATLDVTALSAINGLTASLTTNPGSVTLTDTGTAGGSFTYTANDGSGAANATDTANVTVTRDTTGALEGNNGDNILIGDGDNSTLAGGEGNDLVFAGAGNDTVNWNARSITIPFLGTFDTTNDGRDFVDGGDGALDRFVVNGSGTSEAFVVYARASVPAALAAGLKPNTEIVITRNGTIIAELDNIEEITINTGAGNDTVTAVGNFNPTSLSFNTITINGNEGDDTVDIASLQSAHRIVFRSNGGHDTIVGTLRQQDVIELPPGMKPEDFMITDNGNGTTSLVSASHKITYVGSGKPIVRECTEEEQADQVVATDDSFMVKKGEVLNLTAAMLIANDVDADGDELCIVEVDEDEHGEAVLNADGTITFTPKVGFTGTASFTYLVSDGRGNYDQGKVTIAVNDDTSQPAQPPAEQPPVVEQPVPATPAVPEDLVCQGGRGHDRLWGGDGHDRMYGDKGHDRLYGGDGNDRLFGHDGNDRLCGNAGADRMWGGRGNDTYDVDDRGDRVHEGRNQGTDTVKASVSYSLAGTHVEKLTLTGSADLNGIGNSLDNTLTGNGGHNSLRGGAGQDVLKGGAGDDKLHGGAGADKLLGGSGDDLLKGGGGNDRLTGGTGADTFVFERGGGFDTVTDFRHGQDKIDVSGLSGVEQKSDLHLWQMGSDTMIWNGSDILVLKGVTASDLDNGDFIF